MKRFVFRRYWLWLILCLIVLLCSALGYFLSVRVNQTLSGLALSPGQSALQQTRELLTWVQKNPSGAMPDDLPGYLRMNADCWELLQADMTSSANKYTLSVAYEYDSWDDPNPYAIRGREEARIDINFSDGRRAVVFSEQGGLGYCTEK